ncbi:hypothetical protein [Microbacterium sp.]|uniref:hypothetical protein n=1 Tax=Microbacterium sp. TaxID=51671 RepID=UPI0028119197|nr:hypothetical protein [Microbacterium sp.]
MSAMRNVPVVMLLAASVVLLAGCATGPDRDEVVERFALELESGFGDYADGAFDEVAEGFADAALDGLCGSVSYEAGLTSDNADPQLLYAWRVGCLHYFEDDLSAAQVEETKQMILDHALESVD